MNRPFILAFSFFAVKKKKLKLKGIFYIEKSKIITTQDKKN
jgi:hypothetical protein